MADCRDISRSDHVLAATTGQHVLAIVQSSEVRVLLAFPGSEKFMGTFRVVIGQNFTFDHGSPIHQ